MSTSTAENHYSFTLPSLSYVDTSLEDQNRVEDVPPARAGGFTEWLAERVAAVSVWNAQRRALAELSLMSDRELMDVGLNRGDFVRMFDDAANADLRARGGKV
jgi:uncharacterized protein YjiS (DUF1127 family)